MVRRGAGGVYYWQSKIGGVSRRGSLGTKSRGTARAKLSVALSKARAEGCVVMGAAGMDSFGAALDEWLRRQDLRPELKSSSREGYASQVLKIKRSLDCDLAVRKLRPEDLRKWWAGLVESYAPATANGGLRVMRLVWAGLVEDGSAAVDPCQGLARVPIGRGHLDLVTREEFQAVAESVRSMGRRCSEEAADMIEWLAFSGMRIGELLAMEWADVRADCLVVRGGEEGTKNRGVREVPLIGELVALIDRRRGEHAAGPVFSMGAPGRALTAACLRVGCNHLRVHDLRHLFATTCIEAGVDIPTLADWLGHRDGGALAMRTYAHTRLRHSFDQAKRVRFG